MFYTASTDVLYRRRKVSEVNVLACSLPNRGADIKYRASVVTKRTEEIPDTPGDISGVRCASIEVAGEVGQRNVIRK